MTYMKTTYWNYKIKNTDKLEKRKILSDIYNSLDMEQYMHWISGSRHNPDNELFSDVKSFRKFMLECARENFKEAKKYLIEINSVLGVFNGNESTYWR